MSGLTGANTTCFVCGNDYSDPEHIEQCLNSPNSLEPSHMNIDIDDISIKTTALDRMIEREMQRVERAIRGAIRAGYDGVDINRQDAIDGIGIESIEPWNRPAPDGANGYRTVRYTWDWFSDEELTRILTADNLKEIL